MCWGPYVLMCIYACFENVKVVSPKLRMVRNNSVSLPSDTVMGFSVNESNCFQKKINRFDHLNKEACYISPSAYRCCQWWRRQIPSSTLSSTHLEMSSTEAACGISSPDRRLSSLISRSRNEKWSRYSLASSQLRHVTSHFSVAPPLISSVDVSTAVTSLKNLLSEPLSVHFLQKNILSAILKAILCN